MGFHEMVSFLLSGTMLRVDIPIWFWSKFACIVASPLLKVTVVEASFEFPKVTLPDITFQPLNWLLYPNIESGVAVILIGFP